MTEDSSTSSSSSKPNLQQEMMRSILAAVKASNNLPTEAMEYEYACSFPDFQKAITLESNKVINCISSILKYYGMKSQLKQFETEDKFDYLVDANDSVLERVADLIDIASGKKKEQDDEVKVGEDSNRSNRNVQNQWNKNERNKGESVSIKARTISKSQLLWQDKVDNTETLFEPKLTTKPNALEGLQVSLSKGKQHPYEYEINNVQYHEQHLEEMQPQFPDSVEGTPLIYVDEESKLADMCRILSYEREISVDIEQHSYRSYQGFICLIQISTRRQDFVIDALTLRSHLSMLNQVFTNEKVLKVFHGSHHDILWLQRCASVYVVNMFDTWHAAKLLNHHRQSLAYLTKYYCNIDRDKSYQLADWRQRPLPETMVQYAREDTHYLLYIYDCMKKELIQQDNGETKLLELTLSNSNINALKVYEKPVYKDTDFINLYVKSRKRFHGGQLYSLSALYKWRDGVAREEDESTGYVLPNHMMLHIADVLPREVTGVLACCNPVPTLVHHYLREIHAIILEARKHDKISEEDYFLSRNIDPYTLKQKDTPQMSKSAKQPEEMSTDNLVPAKARIPVSPAPVKKRSSLLHNCIPNGVSVKAKSDFFSITNEEKKQQFEHHVISKIEFPEIVENFISPYQLYMYGKLLEPEQQQQGEDEGTSSNTMPLPVPSINDMITQPTAVAKSVKKLNQYWEQLSVKAPSKPTFPPDARQKSAVADSTSRGWYNTPKYDGTSEYTVTGQQEADGELTLRDHLRQDARSKRGGGGGKKRKKGGDMESSNKRRSVDNNDGSIEAYDYANQSIEDTFPSKVGDRQRSQSKKHWLRRDKGGGRRGGKRGGASAGSRRYFKGEHAAHGQIKAGPKAHTSNRNLSSLSSNS